jgi:PAS domain S-box-containing protein
VEKELKGVFRKAGKTNAGPTMWIILTLTISIALQLAAAFLAVRLIQITGRRIGWSIIAAAVFLMALRRGITLFHFLFDENAPPPSLLSEWIALMISALLAVGIASVTPLFLSMKRTEEALRKSEERFQLSARATKDIIWDWDIPTNTVWWSENFKTTFGYRAEEIEQGVESWSNRVHPEDKERVVSSLQEVIDRGHQVVSFEYRFRRADGSEAIIFDRGYVVHDEHGKAARMIGAMMDITERKRAEEEIKKLNIDLELRVTERTAQLEAANNELESFSYSVSHDLRAPLRATAGFSRVLLARYTDLLDSEGKDFLQRIDAASRRMAELIEDLLNLSRIARTEMRKEPIDISLLARSIAKELQQSEPGRKVTFLIQDDLNISGDPRLLRIVLENLLGNAWKFTSKHPEATIEVGAYGKNKKPTYFVRDDGAGFDMAYGDKLFGAFQRLHSLNEFAGTGIGLATVRRIIRRHGGEVWAEGETEKGTTVYFTI